jgi:RimJ/RimL family protein N-acetyltransferase
MIEPPRLFETTRLTVRAAVLPDSVALFAAYAQDPTVTRFLTWRPHRDETESQQFLSRCEKAWEDGTAYPWVLVLRDSGDLIGMAEMRIRGHLADLGYALARRHWGAGYMTEALKPIVAWAFDQPSIHRVWATCDVENVASARVLERLGMQREGVLRRWILHPNISATPRDSFCYARIREAAQPGIAADGAAPRR